jgi:predicted AAA+ superfamily ATPase
VTISAQYRRRVIDDELDALLPSLPAIEISGARATGKTSTAVARGGTLFALDDPATAALLAADPGRVTSGSPPVVIDEWQRMPDLWDRVRRAVDADRAPGRFLLTGSSGPRVAPVHSGAGRIVSLRMRPMTLPERGVAAPTVSVATLLKGDRPGIDGETDVRADQYAHEIVKSGFPGLQGLPERAARAELDGYLDRLVSSDFEESGHPVRNPARLRRWLEAYAAAVSTTASYETIRDAAHGGSFERPAKTSTLRYIDALENLWLIEPIPGWKPTDNSLSRLTLAPKHELVDPALAARLLGATHATLLGLQPTGSKRANYAALFGALFESLVALSVRVFSQAAEGRVFHFRDYGGEHEVDLIVEGLDQRVLAIEVKLAETPADRDVRHLLWLRDRLGDRLLDAVVVTTGRVAYRRPDGIAVVPAALIGP